MFDVTYYFIIERVIYYVFQCVAAEHNVLVQGADGRADGRRPGLSAAPAELQLAQDRLRLHLPGEPAHASQGGFILNNT